MFLITSLTQAVASRRPPGRLRRRRPSAKTGRLARFPLQKKHPAAVAAERSYGGTPRVGFIGAFLMLVVPKDALRDYIDRELEPSGWLTIDQDRITAFADATLDHQFIHVDEEKAARTPFGRTIAHGYLTMSLISYFAGEWAIRPDHMVMAINYGSDRVRFLQPVRVNSRIRARAVLLDVEEKAPDQVLLKTRFTIEIEGEEKPAMVADILSLFFTA
jgi:acyl dehydratase